MAIDFDIFIENLEALSRKGQGREIPKLYQELNLSKIPRPFKLQLANIARRNGLAHTALKILNPVVRNETLNKDNEATTEEKAEYAVALHYIGANSEAARILDELSTSNHAQVLLYRSFVYFSQWDYKAAIPLLENFIGEVGSDPYQLIIGKVNLAAALIFEKHLTDAQKVLQDLLRSISSSEMTRLYGNCLELSAQSAFELGDYDSALNHLNKAEQLLNRNEGLDRFLVEKWTTLVELHKFGPKKEILEKVALLKNRALAIHHWETIRDIDFYLSTVNLDHHLFSKVFYGTPYPNYQEKMLSRKPKGWQPKAEFLLGPSSNFTHIELDVELGTYSDGRPALKPGQTLHRTLALLARDFYHPRPLGTLFSELHPDEYFDPHSSQDRIYQLIKRLRQYLKKEQLPLEVTEVKGCYGLLCNEGLKLKIHQQNTSQEIHPHQIYLKKLAMEFAHTPFTAKQACSILKISRSAFLRFTDDAIPDQDLIREGRGPGTKYRVAS